MSWLDGPLLALDTETTGTDPLTARALSVTLGLSRRPGAWEPRTWWLTPEEKVPAGAAKVHGLTREIVAERANGQTRREALEEIYDYLRLATHPLVIHNAPYDLTLLNAESRRELGAGIPKPWAVLDTLVLHRRLDMRTGSRTLGKLAESRGITFPAHDSEADALASLRLLHILATENELIEHVDVMALTDLQRGWYTQQQEAAAARAAGSGTPFEPAKAWPFAGEDVES